jgi:hypothetical protein
MGVVRRTFKNFCIDIPNILSGGGCWTLTVCRAYRGFCVRGSFTHHLILTLRMCGAAPPLPTYFHGAMLSRYTNVFMTWWLIDWACRWSESMSLNCGHQRAYCSSPGYIWAWRTMVEKETPDSSTRALWQSYQQIHLVASRGIGRRKLWIWPCEVSLFILP